MAYPSHRTEQPWPDTVVDHLDCKLVTALELKLSTEFSRQGKPAVIAEFDRGHRGDLSLVRAPDLISGEGISNAQRAKSARYQEGRGAKDQYSSGSMMVRTRRVFSGSAGSSEPYCSLGS